MIRTFAVYSRDVKLILLTTLLSNVGIFMVIPFLAIYLNGLGTVNTAQVGLIVGVAFWCQRAGSFLGGIMSDYLHVKGTMLLGLLIRIPGYILVGFVDNWYLLLVSCALIGLGSSIYLPAAKSYLVKIVGEADKVAVLSTRVIFSNIGVAIGPVIGMTVFTLSPSLLFSSVGVIFIALALLNLRLSTHQERFGKGAFSLADLRSLLSDRFMISIALFMFLFMAFYMQIEVTIPMFSDAEFGHQAASYIFICNALVVILFQSSVSGWACSGSAKPPLAIAFILLAACFMLIEYTESAYLLLFAAVILFSFAEIIIQIRLDYDATRVNQQMIATAFGIMSLSGAFGGLFGSYLGTLLYPSGFIGLSLWKWMALCCTAIAIIYLIKPTVIHPGVTNDPAHSTHSTARRHD